MVYECKKALLKGAPGIFEQGPRRLLRARLPKTWSVTCMPRSESGRLALIYIREIMSKAHNLSLVHWITGVMLGSYRACDPGRINLYPAAP